MFSIAALVPSIIFLILWLLERRKNISLVQELKQRISSQAAAEERARQLQAAQDKMSDTFRALSLEALEKNSHSFLELAQLKFEKLQEGAKGELEKKQIAIDELLKPVKETLSKLDGGVRAIEKERKGEQEALKQQLRSMVEAEKHLRLETSNLVKALRTPAARGRWGEIQLRRVVELAGMVANCDFFEQVYQADDEQRMRPDVIVRLPGGRQVIIDAKVPLEAYLEAIHATDEGMKEAKFKEHARQVRAHLQALGKKAYWEHFEPTPEFVVLFLPAETFFSAALEYDPSLIEVGAEQRVILATPTTLIALLRAVAYGWRQETLSRQAEEVKVLGQELYKRIVDMGSHWAKMGRSLSSAVEHYNKATGSLESRVLVTARKFKDVGLVATTIDGEAVESIERTPRMLQADELSST